MSKSMDYLDMMDEDPAYHSSDFLRKFLEKWQKYAAERTTLLLQENHLIFQKITQSLEKMKNADDFRPVLEFILDTVLETIPAEKSSLLLRYADGKMRIALTKGAYAKDQCLTADNEFIQRVLRNKEIVCMSEPHEASVNTLLEENFRWFLPIRNQKKFFGILYIEGKEYHNTPEKLMIAQLLAELAAEAITKSYLIEQNITAWKFIEVMRQKVLYADEMAMRGRLSAPVGHELCNLLKIISGNFEILKSKLVKREINSLVDNIDHVNFALQSATSLAQQLCDIASPDLMLRKCFLNEIINQFLELIKPLYKNTPLKIKQNLSDDLPAIKADPVKIRQLLFNLLNNAFQVKNDVCIIISTLFAAEEGRVKLKVKDDGPGLSKEQLNSIFTPMMKSGKGNYGFGLLLCKEIVDKHGGAISVESHQGKGTEFTISLPVYEGEP